MEKIVVKFDQDEVSSFEYKKQDIIVKSFISLGDEVALISAYLDSYFSPNDKTFSQSDYDYLNAEYALRLGILDDCTNIDVNQSGAEDLIGNIELWQKVTQKIKNYPDFRLHLDCLVAEVKEQIALRKSIGSVIDDLVEKALGVLENLSKIEVNENTLGELRGLIGDLNKGIKEQPVLSEAIADVKKAPRRGRRKKAE